WFLPYVFVDVPMTMTTGREVYGYPKELAYLTWPAGDDDPLVLRAETMVLPIYAKDTKLVRKPILEVRRTSATASLAGRLGAAFEGLAGALEHLGVELDHELGGGLESILSKLEIPMVFLKQF